MIIDCDIHPTILPGDLLTRMPSRWHDRIEGFGFRATASNTVSAYPRVRNQGFRLDTLPADPGRKPADTAESVASAHLDEYDISLAMLYPLQGLECTEAPDIAAAFARAINDWIEEDWLARDSRFLGSIVIPLECPELALAEIERRQASQWRQIAVPASIPTDTAGSHAFWSIYEAAAERSLPVAFHQASYWPHIGTGWGSYYLEEHVAFSHNIQVQLLSLVCDGVLERFPDLRVVMAEGGVSWLAPLALGLDDAWGAWAGSAPPMSRKPSEQINAQVWVTTQPIEEPEDPKDLVEMIELGDLEERLLFASDFPHWDFDSPIQALPRALSKQARERVLWRNATELYGLVPVKA